MKKILVIGSAESVFVRDFISQFSSEELVVDLISLSNEVQGVNARTIEYVPLDIRKQKVLGRQLDLFFRIRAALKKVASEYDAIVIHYVFFFLAPHVLRMRSMTKNIVSVIWGSDFYKSTKIKILLQSVIYRSSKSIVFTNPATKEEFSKKHRSVPSCRLKVARFGLPVLEEIDRIISKKIDRHGICEEFGLPSEKVLIFAGYNANESQQQTLVVEKFSKLDRSLKDKAALIFTLGYGDPSAEQRIRDSLERNHVEHFVVLKKFYGPEEIAKIRCVTDVLINIQPSDQFSGSMQEVLYAGGRVIAGAWLPYKEIIEAGGRIRSINNKDEVGRALEFEINFDARNLDLNNDGARGFIESSSTWRGNLGVWKHIVVP
ncbi:Glycosyltransferase involved in cell wall bisynthesis [Variovorax sp. PDC80]|uniref:glycosyltransferase n=1 Tax=Variovorax sp. PDC80 TaxID=1882827 RepID=UPI0008EA8554|nr:glycosyltransferase [Variovorax sp. PDC80]SFP63978.1 Glycosyltransferase involved in cell wall bisynthesis [Variovorax sp. PDC80]